MSKKGNPEIENIEEVATPAPVFTEEQMAFLNDLNEKSRQNSESDMKAYLDECASRERKQAEREAERKSERLKQIERAYEKKVRAYNQFLVESLWYCGLRTVVAGGIAEWIHRSNIILWPIVLVFAYCVISMLIRAGRVIESRLRMKSVFEKARKGWQK